MANAVTEELEGNTLNVYAFIVHAHKPVGTRDVTRGAGLSSTSVAFRQLQKLESLGLIEKNVYGDYVLKEKANVSGHFWVGRSLMPRLLVYSFFFLGAFCTEVTVILLLTFMGLTIEVSFFFLTGMTAVALVLFFVEGIELHRKIKIKTEKEQ